MSTERLIEAAQKALQKPYDALHDARHHALVWQNCLRIIDTEQLENVDVEALQIAAWWHDVERGKEDEFSLLREELKTQNVDPTFAERVLHIAGNHSFGCAQDTFEAKILFDADKLEYVNFDRLLILLDEYKSGKINQERFNYYVDAWDKRIVIVKDQLHFAYTKEVFKDRLNDAMERASQYPELRAFTQGFVI